jgi:hypothetical protein
MSMQALLEKVVGKSAERQRAKAATWQALVVRVADGKLSDPDKLAEQLEQFDKSAEQLRDAVETLLARRRARAALDAAAGVEDARHAIEAEAQAAVAFHDAEIQRIDGELQGKMAPLHARSLELKAIETAAAAARAELVRTCTVALQEQANELQEKMQALGIEERAARTLRLENEDTGTFTSKLRVEQADAKLADLARQREDLRARLAALEEKKLEV